MSDYMIKVENLSKSYQIKHQNAERYTALRDVITNNVKHMGQRLLGRSNGNGHGPSRETFWALDDVSFEVKQGERVGIIGRNGAGKSTLLKILSRITEPTKGRVRLRGRVASLLEVGTGFHPELTGRENIYLNGAILGMTRDEIKRKFDEIVAFAEVEKFLDTPVKRYSSGMYVRLAFAVAAHLEPEILVVDEVLAVGDAAFQKKCLGKMEDVAGEGRTVLFVSHQMAAIQNLSSRTIWLNKGTVIKDSDTKSTLNEYMAQLTNTSQIPLLDRVDRKGTGKIRFTSFQFQNGNDKPVSTFYSGQDVKIVLTYNNNSARDINYLHVALGIDNSTGQRVTHFSNEVTGEVFDFVSQDASKIKICIPRLPLMPGRYGFTIYCTINGVVADWIQNAGAFDVEAGNYYQTGKLPPNGQGNFLVDHHFKLMV